MLHQVRGGTDDARVEDRTALGVVERGDRHAPGPLPADAPVGARFYGGLDAVFAPVGDPVHGVDGVEGELAKGSCDRKVAGRFHSRRYAVGSACDLTVAAT